ncbi:MAG: response regulator [Desulfovibrionaceae bacterium]|nr:response regulator [Desulfovibrionaceae bacterium]
MASAILLADDEKDFVDTLGERLELRGYAVRVVYDGISALAAAQEALPDIAIVDWLMPGKSGDAVLHELHARQPHLPVILLTGHGARDDHGCTPCAEAFACLTKPVALDTLLEQIQLALGGVQV